MAEGGSGQSFEVAPEITALVGDVTRPRRGFVPAARALEHLPGASGIVTGARNIFGMLTSGEAWMSSLARQYGPVFRYQTGLDPIVCLADADLAWSTFKNEDRAWSAAIPWRYMFGGLMPGETGDSPLMLDFEHHKDARRLLQPAFSASAIASYLEDATRIYQRAIESWLYERCIRFKSEARLMFAGVSAKILMGIDDEREAARLDRAMTDGWQAVLTPVKRSPWSPGWRRAQRGLDVLWNWLRPMVDARRGSGGRDLLSRMCEARDEAHWLDDDDTRMRMFISIMFAAFDTTAAAVTSMGYLLALHPEWQERLRAEALAVRKHTLDPEDLKALPELEWVWKETLRLYPVAGQVVRTSLRDTELGGHHIPAATYLWTLTGTLQHDARWWTAPELFDPLRFAPERAEDKRHKAIYLPFGAGPHTCIGAQLSIAEIKAFWHALLSRARIRLATPQTPRHTYGPIGMLSGNVDLVVDPL